MLPTGLSVPTGVPVVPTYTRCVVPDGWLTFTLRPEITLYALAAATGSSVAALRDVNCIDDDSPIEPRRTLFIPRLPAFPPLPVAPVYPPRAPDPAFLYPLETIGCTMPEARIVSPMTLQTVSGVIEVNGTAAGAGFARYELSIRPAGAEFFDPYVRSETPVRNGTLGQINTGFFGDGLHYLNLTVVDTAGTSALPCVIPLIFR